MFWEKDVSAPPSEQAEERWEPIMPHREEPPEHADGGEEPSAAYSMEPERRAAPQEPPRQDGVGGFRTKEIEEIAHAKRTQFGKRADESRR